MLTSDIREEIDRVLKIIGKHSDSAVQQMNGIAAVESDYGQNLTQIGGGPALGIFGIEPRTALEVWNHSARRRPERFRHLLDLMVMGDMEHNLENHIPFQVAMARYILWRIPEPLPEFDDIMGQARYWKKYWNTEAGKGTIGKYVEKYGRHVLAE